ncbi:DEAD/DEAH box helicase family protein [Paenibacillus sp. NEAU-GSW1]|uniref:DEAD/DEAH box helicase family protein n=1 Tax=Paenibacillus sp. NEAU-GSW1 TaxID=2682486 RepID=UPI0012E193FE|nr:DEAD/DEAH box helicase family protein [Paenibacillus sp. NEAU-GSW1]MUT65718.1 DNA helicase [Paenibacillus sp. NEAU-GSW1]
MPEIKLITENLVDELIPGIQKASGIYILTSFVMESGVRLLAPHLKEAMNRGAEVKLLAGDYLFVSQPEALRALLNIHPYIEARLWRSRGTSFHPKAYLFDYGSGEGLFIVGSSNLSLSAFRMGVEWNLAMNAQAEPFTFQHALINFNRNFYHEFTQTLNEATIANYEKAYKAYHQKFPELVRSITEWEESELMLPQKESKQAEPSAVQEQPNALTPRASQLGALEALADTVEEGYDKAMVVMATGLGKTYLAGFFAQHRFQRVLFIAHREEILHQARRSFLHIMPDKTAGLYNGSEKETGTDFVFASIYTLSSKMHRERFERNAFDLIVVDEFHHAAAKSYQTVLSYFKPRFLLGITATPDRMDGKDVYAICDGNVAYQLHFIEAIQKGWLSPFHYYGIYDATDYSQLTWLGTKYDEGELLEVQLREEVAANIYEGWARHRQTRTIAFCSSIMQANFLSDYFNNQGAASLALHSDTRAMTREEAVRRLESGELTIIFTVDLFNEGVDIPSVDTLLFVRPTQSLTIFTQQIGRGLRLHEGKQTCAIIDLIGNYRNADIKLSLFDTGTGEDKTDKKGSIKPIAPAGCAIELELAVIDMLEELTRKKQPRKDKLRSIYMELKEEIGHRPSYLELHLFGKANSSEYRQEFGSYIGFLHWCGELNEEEETVYLSYERWFKEVESTLMAKSYKMVVLLAMLERGASGWTAPTTPEAAAPFFHRYLTEKEYRRKIDFSDKETQRLKEYDEKKVAKLIADMPMSKWSGSSKGQLTFTDGQFSPQIVIQSEHAELVYSWTKEICEYRLHWHFERKARTEVNYESRSI